MTTTNGAARHSGMRPILAPTRCWPAALSLQSRRWSVMGRHERLNRRGGRPLVDLAAVRNRALGRRGSWQWAPS